jgi:hypothetical protein
MCMCGCVWTTFSMNAPSPCVLPTNMLKKKKLTCHPLISFFFLLFLLSDVKVSQKLIVKAYILEAAMAVHSIIIGFDFGTSEDSVVTLKVLYVAYVFHQVSGCVCVFVFCKNIYLYI